MVSRAQRYVRKLVALTRYPTLFPSARCEMRNIFKYPARLNIWRRLATFYDIKFDSCFQSLSTAFGLSISLSWGRRLHSINKLVIVNVILGNNSFNNRPFCKTNFVTQNGIFNSQCIVMRPLGTCVLQHGTRKKSTGKICKSIFVGKMWENLIFKWFSLRCCPLCHRQIIDNSPFNWRSNVVKPRQNNRTKAWFSISSP